MTDPNIQTIDLLSVLLAPSSNPTTSDVKFIFVNQTSGDKSELSAHKLILACGSEVFMAQFYGSMKEEKDFITVEDSSVEAFQVLLDIFYNKKVLLEGVNYQLLGELFYLAEKYHLNKFQASILKEVSSRKMVPEKLLEAAKAAESNSLLEKFSNFLHQRCSQFVIDDTALVLEIFDKEEVGKENSYILHRLMARVAHNQYIVLTCDVLSETFVSISTN